MANSKDYHLILLAVSWAECGFVMLLFFGRLWSSWMVAKQIRLDSYITIVTMICAFTGQILLTHAISEGLGEHYETLTSESLSKALQYALYFQILAIIAIALAKIIVIVFLAQLLRPRHFQLFFLWFIGVSSTLVNAIIIVLILLQCSPLQKLWDIAVPGTCDGRHRNMLFGFFQGSYSSFCDATLAIYPTTVLWSLHLKLHIKVGLCVLMSCGIFAAVCSAIKTSELKAVGATADITYNLSPLVLWASTEMWIVIAVGCIPPIRPLFVQVMRKFSSSFGSLVTTTRHGYASGDVRLTSVRGTRKATRSSARLHRSDMYRIEDNDDASSESIIRKGDSDEDQIHIQTKISVQTSRRTDSVGQIELGRI